MSQEFEKVEAVDAIEKFSVSNDHDLERKTILPEDGKVSFKTNLAVFVSSLFAKEIFSLKWSKALILMYESYLFTLVMPAAVLQYINQDLGPDSRYPWISITWNLGAAVIVTIGSRLAD